MRCFSRFARIRISSRSLAEQMECSIRRGSWLIRRRIENQYFLVWVAPGAWAEPQPRRLLPNEILCCDDSNAPNPKAHTASSGTCRRRTDTNLVPALGDRSLLDGAGPLAISAGWRLSVLSEHSASGHGKR